MKTAHEMHFSRVRRWVEPAFFFSMGSVIFGLAGVFGLAPGLRGLGATVATLGLVAVAASYMLRAYVSMIWCEIEDAEREWRRHITR